MTAEYPGVVFVRQYCDDKEESVSVLRPSLMEDDVVQFPEMWQWRTLILKELGTCTKKLRMCVSTQSPAQNQAPVD